MPEDKNNQLKDKRRIDACIFCEFHRDTSRSATSPSWFCSKYKVIIDDIHKKPEWCKVEWFIVIYKGGG